MCLSTHRHYSVTLHRMILCDGAAVVPKSFHVETTGDPGISKKQEVSCTDML